MFDEVISVTTGGRRRFILIGGGAAESKDEARVDAGPMIELGPILSSPARKMAGPILSSLQG